MRRSKTQDQRNNQKTKNGSLIRKPIQIIMSNWDLPKLDMKIGKP